ncbi:MAG: carboxylating nicotinate-nucleotide diphosphorylase [Melioribacter sp.]|nr:carboxylating nicotinate-nucleotide diphosphorylase [Melioribacter sp.]
MNKKILNEIISIALKEDIGDGDITTNSIVPKSEIGKGFIVAKEEGIIAGLFVAKEIFRKLDNKISFKYLAKEGEKVIANQKIAEIKGSLRALLTGERTALNFLQRMSGIATITSMYVSQLRNTKVKILDTRKTVPCLRIIDKYSVRIGGGKNHRFGLYDMILIKDNHIKAAGSITNAVNLVKKNLKKKVKIEVETKSLDEVKEAITNKVDIIMLDNMSIETMKEAVRLIHRKAKIEVSGNVTLDNVREIAKIGIDYISVGALTHSVRALDINMKIETL